MEDSPTTEPEGQSRSARVLSASILLVTAAVLWYVGLVLPPDSVEAMDGFQRLFFAFVPIRPFAWVMAVVFAFLGIRGLTHQDSADPDEGSAADT